MNKYQQIAPRFYKFASLFGLSQILISPSGKQALQTGNHPTTVLIIAASARAIAQCIVRSRHFEAKPKMKIVAADLFSDADTQQACSAIQIRDYPNEFVSVMERIKPDYVVYSGGLENHDEVIEAIEQKTTVLGNGSEVLKKLQDKAKLFELLNEMGFAVPKSHFMNPNIRKPNLPCENRWLRKNIKSCGGLGVYSADPPALGSLQSEKDAYYFQEQIGGESYSAIFVATKDKTGKSNSHWLGTTIQLTGDRRFNAAGFLYTGSIFSNQLTSSQNTQLASVGQLIAERFGMIGLFNIDFIKRDEQIFFIEVNPRFSASMELLDRAMDARIFDLHRKACLGKDIDISKHAYTANLKRFGKAVCYADQDCMVTQRFFDYVNCQNASAIKQSEFPIVADIPPANTKIKMGQPVLTVFASDKSEIGVDEKLVRAATMFASRLND